MQNHNFSIDRNRKTATALRLQSLKNCLKALQISVFRHIRLCLTVSHSQSTLFPDVP